MRPPIPYFGGKMLVGPAIADLLPPHGHYVEPYCGSLAVLLAKAPSDHETVNDLDGRLMTFWRVLRDRPDDLARTSPARQPDTPMGFARTSSASCPCEPSIGSIQPRSRDRSGGSSPRASGEGRRTRFWTHSPVAVACWTGRDVPVTARSELRSRSATARSLPAGCRRASSFLPEPAMASDPTLNAARERVRFAIGVGRCVRHAMSTGCEGRLPDCEVVNEPLPPASAILRGSAT